VFHTPLGHLALTFRYARLNSPRTIHIQPRFSILREHWLTAGHLPPRRVSACGAMLLCVLSTCGRAEDDASGALAAALAAAPGIAPRLSVETPFRRCVDRVPEGGTIPRADCPAPRTAEPAPAALPGIDPRSDDPRSIQMLALLDLAAVDPRGISLENSIASLRRAAELADNPASALVDLSAALIVRAERTQAPRDLLEAYEIAQKAVDREPGNAAALYNRALALDRFGLVEETAEDWKLAIAADSKSGWADEARRRLDALRAIRPPTPPRDDAPLADYARYAAEEPQGARELGMDRLLAEWGEAVERRDSARADDRLRRADALGTALLRRPGGDASLADMVRAIHAVAADSAATRKLAQAHREYGRARSEFAATEFEDAQALFAAAEAKGAASTPLQQWSRIYWASARASLLPRNESMRLLERTVPSVSSRRYPALAGRARLSLATFLSGGELWERGLDEAMAAYRFYAAAAERVNQAAAANAIADARFTLGEPDSGYTAVHRALQNLKGRRDSPRLHTLLASFSDVLAGDGLTRAALRLQDEDVRIATGPLLAEAHLRRARLHAALGSVEPARRDVEIARPIVQGLDTSFARQWLAADLQEANALTLLHASPHQRAAAFDSAAAFFSRINLPFRFLPQLVGAADARLAAGDRADAAVRLERVIGILEQRRDSIGMEPRRAAVFDAARAVVNRIVMLELGKGQPATGLTYMDQARASLAPIAPTLVDRDAPIRSRPGEITVEYAFVGDTLLTWTVSDRTVHVSRAIIDTLWLARTTEELQAKLERQAGPDELRQALSQLYDALVRPVESRLGRADTPLAIIADGQIAAIPFAALLDARRDRYLVQDHPIRFEVSLRQASLPRRAPAPTGTVLLLADPAFDLAEHPLLERLPNALTEVRALERTYGTATVLEGASATRVALTASLSHARLAHFAGHAVFDDARPERSYLVLASTPHGKAPGTLKAAEFARMDLRHLDLVVLAACKTMRGGRSRAAGYTGLAGALLAAGAGGTLGSTSDVDDESTATLLRAFHEAYSSSADPSRSLHAAQRALLRSSRSRLRSPSAWAAFRYTGR